MKLAIVIPAYNEEAVIGDVLKSLPKKLDGIDEIASIVVDDGSKDSTLEIAKKRASYALSLPINMGVGTATITGLEKAKLINFNIVVTIDADGQHAPNDIEKVIKPIVDRKADVVIGTRMKNTKGMPLVKRFGNFAMNLLTYLVFYKWSSDTQSGMKAFSKNALEKMNLHSVGYEICSEIIGEVQRNKLIIAEVPIEVIYTDYSKLKGQNILNAVNILTRSLVIKMLGKR